jgi:signal-transduction protein with cAMP-binding, CBS, and nucleotidyltransferase domain
MKTLKDLVSRKNHHFNIIDPDVLVADAITIMENKNTSYLVVMNAQNYLGLITDYDCMGKIIMHRKKAATTRVKEMMRTDLPVISMDEVYQKCLDIMSTFRIRHIPVFEEFHFITVISIDDLYKELILEERKDLPKQTEVIKTANPNPIQTKYETAPKLIGLYS